MRYILSTISLVLLSACSGSTSDTNTGPVQTAQLEKAQGYEDFSGHFSSDGNLGAFTSLRDDSVAHVYLYASQATPQLVRFDDRLGLNYEEGQEILNAVSPSVTWVAMNRVALATGLTQLIVGHVTGTSKAVIDLPADHSISELVYAKGSENYLAYVDRSSALRSLKVIKLTGDATTLTLQEVGSFDNEEQGLLSVVNGQLTLASVTSNGVLEQTYVTRNFDENAATWTQTSDGSLKQSVLDQGNPALLTEAGLFTSQTSTANRTRRMLGTAPIVAADNTTNVTVLEDVKQTNLFQAALTYDWTQASYLADEPLTIADLSGTLNGDYMLVSSRDGFTCVQGNRLLPAQKLIRRSDMKVMTFMIARVATSVTWSEVIPQACAVVDNTIEGGLARITDNSINQAELLGLDGEFFVVLLNSFNTGDQELKIARFKYDWTTGVVSEVTITDVSANPRT